MNHRHTLLLSLLTLTLSGPSSAQVYKCQQENGSSVFSNLPCPKASSTIKVVPVESISEQARLEAERAIAQMRKDAEELEAKRLAEAAARRDISADSPPAGPATPTGPAANVEPPRPEVPQ